MTVGNQPVIEHAPGGSNALHQDVDLNQENLINSNNTASDALINTSDNALRAVTLTPVVDATNVAIIPEDLEDEQFQEDRQRRKYLWMGACACLVLALCIIIPLSVTAGDNNSPIVIRQTSAPTPLPTAMPTASPSLEPTPERLTEMIEFLQQQSTLDSDDDVWWEDRSSAPYQAALWLAESNAAESYTTTKLLQRFSLATFYFSTSSNDQQWKTCGQDSVSCAAGKRWLSDQDECQWQFVACQEVQNDDNEEEGLINVVIQLSFPALGNNLHGTLPPQLSLLSNLQVFAVPNNAISGGNIMINDDDDDDTTTIHSIDVAFQGISSLRALTLPSNNFTGTLPTQILNNNLDLQLLILGKNKFHGSIPEEVSRISNLVDLQLEGNQLVGAIPEVLSSNTMLEHVELQSNQLTASLPQGLYSLTALTSLNISHNLQLTGTLAADSISQLFNLERFAAGHTQLSGTIPEIVFSSWTNLEELDLGHASFSGTVSESIANWNQSLQVLNLHHNGFEGQVPQGIGALTILSELRLEGNELTGRIPSSVCENRGAGFEELRTLTVDCQVECNCCDNQHDC